jgi:hypothetical protein
MIGMKKLYMYCVSLFLLLVSVILILNTQGITITGAFSVVDLAPQNFSYEEPVEMSQESAFFALKVAEEDVVEIRTTSVLSSFVEDALLEANKSYHEENYTNVFKTTQLIRFIKAERILLLDRINLTVLKENLFIEEGVNTSEGHDLLGRARTSFEQERYDETHEFLNQAVLEFEKSKIERNRKKTVAHLSKNFVRRYWWQLSLMLIVLVITAPIIFKRIRKHRLKRKLEALQQELEKSKEMIKRLQKSCFVDKKISPSTYKAKVAKFEERIAEIKHTIPVLEAQLQGRKRVKREKKKQKGIIEVKQ